MPEDCVGIGINGAIPEPRKHQYTNKDGLLIEDTSISKLRILLHVLTWRSVEKLKVREYQKQYKNNL